MITDIEKHSLAAIPAIETEIYDGWLIRLAGNHTRRANSVNVLKRGKLPLGLKIPHCEEIYAGNRQPCHFRLTPLAEPELEPLLEARGYCRSGETEVRVCPLLTAESPNPGDPEVTIETTPTAFWRDGLARLTGQDKRQQIIFREMLERVKMPIYCAAILEDGEIIACGLAVGSKKYLGLFEFAAHPAHRRKGLAGAIVRALFARARADGMTTAYLQVVRENEAGRAFWERMGFTELLYGYHYRTKL